MAGKWDVGGYDSQGTFGFSKAVVVPGEGVGFEFLNRPDTAFLLTEHPAYRPRLLGDLTEATVTAQVGVSVTAGTQFTYFGEPDGTGRVANARFIFSTDTPLGTLCPCGDGTGLSSTWMSDPVSVDLEALKAGTFPLTVAMDPAQWTDLESRRGDSDDAHRGYFARAVADVDTIGLAFGGGRGFSDGVGIVDGSGAGSFHLLGFTAS